MNLLAAVRCGEMQPIMLARTIATLDHMLEGRLTINIISSDFQAKSKIVAIAINDRVRLLKSCAKLGHKMRSIIRARFINLKIYQLNLRALISKMVVLCFILAATLLPLLSYVPSIVMCI